MSGIWMFHFSFLTFSAGQNFTVLLDSTRSVIIVFGDNKYSQLGLDPQESGPGK